MNISKKKIVDYALVQCSIYGEYDFSTHTYPKQIDLKLSLLEGVQCWCKPSASPFKWLAISGEEAFEIMNGALDNK